MARFCSLLWLLIVLSIVSRLSDALPTIPVKHDSASFDTTFKSMTLEAQGVAEYGPIHAKASTIPLLPQRKSPVLIHRTVAPTVGYTQVVPASSSIEPTIPAPAYGSSQTTEICSSRTSVAQYLPSALTTSSFSATNTASLISTDLPTQASSGFSVSQTSQVIPPIGPLSATASQTSLQSSVAGPQGVTITAVSTVIESQPSSFNILTSSLTPTPATENSATISSSAIQFSTVSSSLVSLGISGTTSVTAVSSTGITVSTTVSSASVASLLSSLPGQGSTIAPPPPVSSIVTQTESDTSIPDLSTSQPSAGTPLASAVSTVDVSSSTTTPPVPMISSSNTAVPVPQSFLSSESVSSMTTSETMSLPTATSSVSDTASSSITAVIIATITSQLSTLPTPLTPTLPTPVVTVPAPPASSTVCWPPGVEPWCVAVSPTIGAISTTSFCVCPYCYLAGPLCSVNKPSGTICPDGWVCSLSIPIPPTTAQYILPTDVIWPSPNDNWSDLSETITALDKSSSTIIHWTASISTSTIDQGDGTEIVYPFRTWECVGLLCSPTSWFSSLSCLVTFSCHLPPPLPPAGAVPSGFPPPPMPIVPPVAPPELDPEIEPKTQTRSDSTISTSRQSDSQSFSRSETSSSTCTLTPMTSCGVICSTVVQGSSSLQTCSQLCQTTSACSATNVATTTTAPCTSMIENVTVMVFNTTISGSIATTSSASTVTTTGCAGSTTTEVAMCSLLNPLSLDPSISAQLRSFASDFSFDSAILSSIAASGISPSTTASPDIVTCCSPQSLSWTTLAQAIATSSLPPSSVPTLQPTEVVAILTLAPSTSESVVIVASSRMSVGRN